MAYINKKTRDLIKNKYGGLCAYSGTVLEDDWQIDHVHPLIRGYDGLPHPLIGGKDDIENMVPCQRLINHYKRALPLDLFRKWYLGGLHDRLRNLPKNPKTKKSIKRKEYLLKVASYFAITPDRPFDGIFYFEKMKGIEK